MMNSPCSLKSSRRECIMTDLCRLSSCNINSDQSFTAITSGNLISLETTPPRPVFSSTEAWFFVRRIGLTQTGFRFRTLARHRSFCILIVIFIIELMRICFLLLYKKKCFLCL
ncbi:hypothetical protein EX30DRAFT_221527 [Ascodesmis nigricans]|uniref:Uncharacterized protein n=1 Tax=Ascodesmis nigricans TaxID=341454 RepID=A0A4S2N084_9PEZI|nr:hypothetical protein EX30DRAFT_221527 [Ascodesmis nigricans]